MPRNSSLDVPTYLSDYADLYAADPRAAARQWFSQARFGLFMHYGVYSLLGRGEWVQHTEQIPVAEYEKLKANFTAEKFDAGLIADLAVDAGMKYINITTRHHDSFCLFATRQTDFNSTTAPAKRDLVGELAEACRDRKLGFFMYYSYAQDWRHPAFRASGISCNPALEHQDAAASKFSVYIDFVHAQLEELLSNYGPVAGIWFDPIMGYYNAPEMYPIHETYALIRSLQPQVLISFKQGATGDEDFAAPERMAKSLADRLTDPHKRALAQAAWAANRDKHNESCDTMQPGKWGYNAADEGQHLNADQVIAKLDEAWADNCNLLMNTGPLPDGSIHAGDAAVLREVGRRLG